MKLGLAVDPFREALSVSKKSMTLDDFVDLASTFDLDAVEPTSGTTFPDPADAAVLPRRCAGTPS